MPVTIYQVADAAAQDSKLEHLLFIWEVNEPKPISHGGDLGNYGAKIAALASYLDNEHVRSAVMKMRAEIGTFIRATCEE